MSSTNRKVLDLLKNELTKRAPQQQQIVNSNERVIKQQKTRRVWQTNYEDQHLSV